MRLLGIDFGFKRIGLAVAETEFGIITARPAIEASGTLKNDAQRLIEIARQDKVDAVVVGLPLESGVEGKMARICRTVAEQIGASGLTVHLIDESLSSVAAEATLREDNLKASQRRKLQDGEAARVILERFIHEHEVG